MDFSYRPSRSGEMFYVRHTQAGGVLLGNTLSIIHYAEIVVDKEDLSRAEAIVAPSHQKVSDLPGSRFLCVTDMRNFRSP